MDIAPKYAAEVERLKDAKPDEIKKSWDCFGPLFQACDPSGRAQDRPSDRRYCGCLTQVRACQFPAWNDRLTKLIREDERLPRSQMELAMLPPGSPGRLAALVALAEWQTRLDAEIRQPEA